MGPWKRGRGRRRKKKDLSEVEATGRIGQPKSTDASKPQPLQPLYYDAHQPLTPKAESPGTPRAAVPRPRV
ncbi:MAG: hypothetical protein ACRD2R_04785, partial [Terriglobales bacterium]